MSERGYEKVLILRQNWGFHCGRDYTMYDGFACTLAWGRKQNPELGEIPFKHNLKLWPLFHILWYRWRSPWGKFYDFPARIWRW